MGETVILRDLHELGYCNRGSKLFFSKHNIDWSDFIINGVSFEILLNLDDAMATKAVNQAEKRLENEAING